jgi:hypothetical protein
MWRARSEMWMMTESYQKINQVSKMRFLRHVDGIRLIINIAYTRNLRPK